MTYGDSLENSFETLCTQIFERFLRRRHNNDLVKFRVINGAGGDGGIEAYGELASGYIVAVQAKWFREVLKDVEIGQIRNSITTAMKLRPKIKEYIICIPHEVSSLKFGRGKKGEEKKPIENYEEKTVDEFTKELYGLYPDLQITWWFEKEIELELQQPGNEGVFKFWFDREIISLQTLKKKFELERTGWLNERYIPELHGQGQIRDEYQKVCFSSVYRAEMCSMLEKTAGDLRTGIWLIDKFVGQNSQVPSINNELDRVRKGLTENLHAIELCQVAHKKGNDDFKVSELPDLDVWTVITQLRKLKAHNLQKNTLPKLLAVLETIHRYNLKPFLDFLRSSFTQYVKLIIGDPGTGKTHGLANCVESHLVENGPAILIQAKGSPVRNWTDLLCDSLELTGWQKDEILAALEALAERSDVQKAAAGKPGEEIDGELTKVIICVDGLDEDNEHFEEWYSRIRESVKLSISHPRVRFVFSARRYFYNNEKLPDDRFFDSVTLPHEGDVSIMKVAPIYFSKQHYNIQLPSYAVIRGIDSLLALRLFCEEYRNKTIKETDQIITATRDLINLKIDRVNKEFVALSGRQIGSTRNPILDAMTVIAEHFYGSPEIEHNQLVSLVASRLNPYLDGSGIDSLIDYLARNGFLIRSQRTEGAVLKKKSFFYSVTYQSLIEHIISEEIYQQILTGSLSMIPEFLHRTMAAPRGQAVNPLEVRPNVRIIQNIVNNLLAETGKLIGVNDFLKEGFDDEQIVKLQLTAIAQAPRVVAEKFAAFVDKMFDGGYVNFSYVVEYLILPSSYSSESLFGAEYLHTKLAGMPSVFDRDKKWSGFDPHEEGLLSEDERHRYNFGANKILFTGISHRDPELQTWNLHNDRPLVFAWGLSTIDQQLRHKLRVALTGWAVACPYEFLLLLKKVFSCDDPQIHEDLASVALGVASRVKDPIHLQPLAQWALDNVFYQLEVHRNVIVRQGFRALVERAYQVGAVSEQFVEQCRPRPMDKVVVLPLAEDLEMGSRGECYPIVHDLAWYVINEAYDKFLEVPSAMEDGVIDNDCPEAKNLLNEYRKIYNNPNLYAFNWTLAVAIAYIRNLGFSRTEGNSFTDATHGSKSDVFTYEEKYTWLAVHFIQGYLADYVPAEEGSDKRAFIRDYSQLTDLANPAESLINAASLIRDQTKNAWVIKESLTRELSTSENLRESITNWVNEEPTFDPDKWISFESTDFYPNAAENKKWTALLNHTALHDSEQYCYSRLDVRAALLRSVDLATFKNLIDADPDSLDFIKHLDGFHASPATDTYSNPTDIAWMTWIEENYSTESFFDSTTDEEKFLNHTLTRIVQTGVEGEKYWLLPSKEIRTLIECYDFENGELKDATGAVRAFVHKASDGRIDDNQEMVLIDAQALQTLRAAGYEVVWFFEHFKEKNPLDKGPDKDFHVQKVRKYFVWPDEEKKWDIYKFWDEWAANVRDKDVGEETDL